MVGGCLQRVVIIGRYLQRAIEILQRVLDWAVRPQRPAIYSTVSKPHLRQAIGYNDELVTGLPATVPLNTPTCEKNAPFSANIRLCVEKDTTQVMPGSKPHPAAHFRVLSLG